MDCRSFITRTLFALALLFASSAGAAQLFIRTDCNTVGSPALHDVCWDATADRWERYDGAVWVATTSPVDQTGAYVWTGTHSWRDNNFSILDNADTTKVAQFQLSGITTGTTRTYTLLNASSNIALVTLVVGVPGAGSCLVAGEFKINTDVGGLAYKCRSAGGEPESISGAEADTLQTVFDRGKVITNANSFANGVHIGASSTTGGRIYEHATNGFTINCVIGGVENDCDYVRKLNSGKKFEIQNSSAAVLFSMTEAGVYTCATCTVTKVHPMKLSTVSVSNANAFVDTIDGTNFDYSGVRFVDAVTGDAFFAFKLPPNLAATPAWNLVITHKAISGAGGNVVLTVSALDFANNVAFDAALTALHTTATFTVSTSANTTITTLSGTNYDSTEAIAASNMLIVKISRVGGNASDTVNADWLLLDVSVRFDEKV